LPLQLTQPVQFTLHLQHLLLHGVHLRGKLAKLLLDAGVAAAAGASASAARAHFVLQPDDPVIQRVPLVGLRLVRACPAGQPASAEKPPVPRARA
jgi:hypothetical protein